MKQDAALGAHQSPPLVMALVKNHDDFTGWCSAAGGLVRKGAYQKILDGLAALSVPEPAKRQFEELIRKSAALDGISSIDRLERVKFTRHLLDQGESRATICRRLQAKYGIGRSQAYLVIAEAL